MAVLTPDKYLQVVVRSCAPGVPPLVEGASPRSVPSPRVGSPPRRHGSKRQDGFTLDADLAENGSSSSSNLPQEGHLMEKCSDVDPFDTGVGGVCDASRSDGDYEAPVAFRFHVQESRFQALAPVEGWMHVPRSPNLGPDTSVDPEVEKNPKEDISPLAIQNSGNLKEGDNPTDTEVPHAFVNVSQELGPPKGQGSMAGYPLLVLKTW